MPHVRMILVALLILLVLAIPWSDLQPLRHLSAELGMVANVHMWQGFFCRQGPYTYQVAHDY
jgi:hypothetical protein